ncbi:acyltransferase [Synechocystis sp. PCC 7509]|uniref:acyltransferase n=1 Tax=Synechocystis sp. PCC 7509 TaxID=927677 RepID=UPI0002AD0401|nr:acyltransferase [Synechocystis sp. PCC 7509]
MEKKPRLTGIDLLKGLAAFAVVVIHAKTGSVPSGNPVYWAEQLVQFSDNFAVPFFLAASFYLMIQKIYSNDSIFYSFKSRFNRLVVPYIVWSLIYLFFRGFKHLINNDLTKLRELFSDPIALIFFGSASGQLYFIPLLLSGIFLVTVVMKPLFKKPIDLKISGLLIILSIIVNQLLSQNLQSSTLIMDDDTNAFTRVILVVIAWMVRCLPYIFVAMVLNHPSIKQRFSSFNIKYALIFIIISLSINALDVFNILNLPVAINEVATAYFALLFGIALSNLLKENGTVTSLGLCSFGIYLIHFISLAVVQPFVYKVFPGSITVLTLLISASVAFLISWVVTLYLMKAKWISRFLFFA